MGPRSRWRAPYSEAEALRRSRWMSSRKDRTRPAKKRAVPLGRSARTLEAARPVDCSVAEREANIQVDLRRFEEVPGCSLRKDWTRAAQKCAVPWGRGARRSRGRTSRLVEDSSSEAGALRRSRWMSSLKDWTRPAQKCAVLLKRSNSA